MGILELESASLAFLAKHVDAQPAVSFSGGKDSLVALDLANRVGVRRAVFCDTTMEFDETIAYVAEVSKFYDINIDIVRAPCDFFQLLERICSPSRRQRWCCDVLKFGPLASWAYKNRVNKFITGLRSDESRTRLDYGEVDRNPIMRVGQINPILRWTNQDVWNYIELYRLPVNPLYEKFSRVGCWCCPFKSASDWKVIEKDYPEKLRTLNEALEQLADRLGIKNKNQFVHERGWTYWIHSTRKVAVGVNALCSGGKHTNVVVSADLQDHLTRIADILPVLVDDFRIIGNKLRISTESTSKKKLSILLERALNCVGCGACLSYCSKGALHIKNGHIAVDEDLCNQCHACLNASTLKGSCVARHYLPKRSALVDIVGEEGLQNAQAL